MKRTLVTCFLAVGTLASCASSVANRDPTGEMLPTVRGESLAGKDYTLPQDFAGAPILLLIGYVQDAQFDIDRWLLGLIQAEINVAFFEVPTVEGMLPGLFSNQIDAGMRAGIPDADEAAVITVYSDAGTVVRFTGNERPRNARALLLDATGKVVWFHDQGYSPRVLLEMETQLKKLNNIP